MPEVEKAFTLELELRRALMELRALIDAMVLRIANLLAGVPGSGIGPNNLDLLKTVS